MRRIFIAATIIVLAASASAWGQAAAPAAGEVVCPLCTHRFVPPAGGRGDRMGGMDSDQCWHPTVSQPLPYLVTVCPRCNFTASTLRFPEEIPAEKRGELLRMLMRSKYRGVVDTIASIPATERFRLAAQCARVLGRSEERLAAAKFGAWSARIEACHPAAASYQMVMPLPQQVSEKRAAPSVESLIAEIERKIAAATDAGEKNRLTLHLAMMCERAGFAAKRDAVVAQLQKTSPADASVKRFVELLGVERDFQTELADLLRESIALEKDDNSRSFLIYERADTLRRLGRNAEAIEEYRAARKLMPNLSDYRIYIDHFLTMLAPGEPLPKSETPKPVPPAAPTTPDAETP